MNNLIVVSGPSGSGKSTLIRRLLQKHPELVFSTSHTTRSRREREIDGKDYHFVSTEEFRRMIESDEFVEWAQVYGNYYGTSYGEIESKTKESQKTFLVLDIDVQGARNIKKKYPDALFVFIIPPT
ncbi:MAG TPA: guanylate kinase, partial [Candidatus Kapabacteria bacterium]|nr:guanylate kinase [Candidatus Kapabacteria bacterium]